MHFGSLTFLQYPKGEQRQVSNMLLDPNNWKRYCKKELATRTLRNMLVATVMKVGAMSDEDVEKMQSSLQVTADIIQRKREGTLQERKKPERPKYVAFWCVVVPYKSRHHDSR